MMKPKSLTAKEVNERLQFVRVASRGPCDFYYSHETRAYYAMFLDEKREFKIEYLGTQLKKACARFNKTVKEKMKNVSSKH